jgi:hypothetical protein
MGQKRNARMVLMGNIKERDRFEDLGVDGRIQLKWILKKEVSRMWTGLIWLRTRTSGLLL